MKEFGDFKYATNKFWRSEILDKLYSYEQETELPIMYGNIFLVIFLWTVNIIPKTNNALMIIKQTEVKASSPEKGI